MDNLSLLDQLFAGLKFKDAMYREKDNTCIANFLYNPDVFNLTDDNRAVIYNKLKQIIGSYVKLELMFIKCPLDKHVIANHTYTTIINLFPALSANFSFDDVTVDINEMSVNLKLMLAPSAYDYATSLNRQVLVADKLKESFLAEFNVEFVKKPDEYGQTNAIKNNMEFISSIKVNQEKTVYTLTNIANIIGKNDYSIATDFSKVKTAMENVVICGEISRLKKKDYTRSYTKNNTTKEIKKVYYNFSLNLNNKFIYCSIFPKQADEAKGDLLQEGMKVCLFGSFREYAGKLSFTATSVARCEYKKEEVKSSFKHVNEAYHTVHPQIYVEVEQKGLFDDEKVFPGTFVVFDLETTGLDGNKDEIIEIGACKIVSGEIVETFSTFVKPSRHIPDEITQLTGIDDNMVKDAPTINYVLPDFYKFCYGSTMVGHNVNFDISFIYTIAKKMSYNFDNPLMDTYEMARKNLPGLKNYKLGTVVEKLGIVLENAHRAINDATATAKVFKKLM